MRLVPFLAPTLLLTSLAPAATVMMRFETTVDATDFGGSASVPLVATYSFDSNLVAESGAISEFYGPLIGLELSIGSETLNTFSMVAGSGMTVWNNGPDGDAYNVVVNFYTPQSVFGVGVNGFHLLLIDPSGSMFSDSSLPTYLNLDATTCFQQMGVDFMPFATEHDLGVIERDDTAVGDRRPFTLIVVPEPGSSMFIGFAVLGSALIRRRGRR